jgi:hypothetical protein
MVAVMAAVMAAVMGVATVVAMVTAIRVYYNNIVSFYFDVDPGWREYYRDHNWAWKLGNREMKEERNEIHKYRL